MGLIVMLFWYLLGTQWFDALCLLTIGAEQQMGVEAPICAAPAFYNTIPAI